MSNIKDINLGFSCPLDQSSLQKENGAFHCANCSRLVVDFTHKTQSELNHVLETADSKVCGVFKPDQLSKTFLKYAAMTALVGSSYMATAQGQYHIQTDSMEEVTTLMGEVVFGEVVGYHQPEPVGGMNQLYEALMQEVKYPDSLTTDGRTYLQFTVKTNGKIADVTVIKGFDPLADAEAVRAFKAINHPFKPATEGGEPIATKMVLPVAFSNYKGDLPGEK